MTDEMYIKEAIRIAEENVINVGGGPFGALIVKGDMIISEAVNTVTLTNDPTAHAEVNAIRAACKALNTFDLSGSVLYSSCEPCPMCLSAIYWAHIDKIYYAASRYDAQDAGFDDSFIYEELNLPISERHIKIIRLLSADGRLPFDQWKKNITKVPY
ncbi:MAG: nucleoside deaminase [Dysgonamonadaceae bacterium]|jgi:tRNA(Arg) A34 adenosine deaminase TadA|nr:nucleoside deaminase [Dysgonamonadaceae bacterium]